MQARMKAALVLCAALSIVAGLAVPASAGVDLPDTVLSWLGARGLEPADAIVQSGNKLYAGPSCPGEGWDCAPVDGPVVQVVEAGGVGQVDCTDPSVCTVNQQSDGGTLTGNCLQVARGDSTTQSCDITQSNTTGSNTIRASQQAVARGGFTQDARQTVACSQTNGSGTNDLLVSQVIDQQTSANLDVPATHDQEGHAVADCSQLSDSGDQSATISQTDQKVSDLFAPAITQKQNDNNNERNAFVNLAQNSTGGDGFIDIDQLMDLDQSASAVNGLTQIQGPGSASGLADDPEAGLMIRAEDIDTDTGTITMDVDQSKVWDQSGSTILGTHKQVQDDQIDCCLGLDKIVLSPSTLTIDHLSDLSASRDDALQRAEHRVRAHADVLATWTSTIVFDGDAPIVESKSGNWVVSGKDCTQGTSCSQQNPTTNMLAGRVRCEVPCGETEYQLETTGPSDGRYGYQVLFQNQGDQPAPDIRITFTVPNGVRVTSAPGCQTNGGMPGAKVRCLRGTGLPGETKEVLMALHGLGTAVSVSTIALDASVTTGNSGPDSAEAYIHIS
jgi:hypothetical protein